MSNLSEMISQILKYNVDTLSPLAAALESNAYAREHMTGKPRFANRLDLLAFAISQATNPGLVLEFGVNDGSTLRHIARCMPTSQVFGFDSFEGLPEAWAGAPAGTFAQAKLPDVPENVQLVQGWFDRTLPGFVDSRKDAAISFLHIDCDLYTSTQTVLTQLRGKIISGTIITFDEYFNYPDWKKHEYLAFKEFIGYTGLKYEYIGLCPQYEHVAVKIL